MHTVISPPPPKDKASHGHNMYINETKTIPRRATLPPLPEAPLIRLPLSDPLSIRVAADTTAAVSNLGGAFLHSHGLDLAVESAARLCLPLDGLLVGGEVEEDEQHEVGTQNGAAGHGRKRVAGALSDVRKPGGVGAGVVVPAGKVHKTCKRTGLEQEAYPDTGRWSLGRATHRGR